MIRSRTGGGSGHKPAFLGFIGKGMLDAVTIGDIFTSPPPTAVYEGAKAVNGGKGVLFLLGNYSALGSIFLTPSTCFLGEHAEEWATSLFMRCQHPEQGYRTVLGVIQLAQKYSPERVNGACKRAIAFDAYTYRSIKSILEKGLDSVPVDPPSQSALPEHENIRGAAYYAEEGGDLKWASNKH